MSLGFLHCVPVVVREQKHRADLLPTNVVIPAGQVQDWAKEAGRGVCYEAPAIPRGAKHRIPAVVVCTEDTDDL